MKKRKWKMWALVWVRKNSEKVVGVYSSRKDAMEARSDPATSAVTKVIPVDVTEQK